MEMDYAKYYIEKYKTFNENERTLTRGELKAVRTILEEALSKDCFYSYEVLQAKLAIIMNNKLEANRTKRGSYAQIKITNYSEEEIACMRSFDQLANFEGITYCVTTTHGLYNWSFDHRVVEIVSLKLIRMHLNSIQNLSCCKAFQPSRNFKKSCYNLVQSLIQEMTGETEKAEEKGSYEAQEAPECTQQEASQGNIPFDVKAIVPRYIAGGAPTSDTLRHYDEEISNFLNWCSGNAYEPLKDIAEPEAYQYLDYLTSQLLSPATINLKICAARTFYFVANRLNLFGENPFKTVKPKKPVYDDADFEFFNIEELKEICEYIIARNDIVSNRDLAIVMLMAVEGLRTVEVHRMSDEDINWKNKSILVHGKGRDSYIYPCEDTFEILQKYLDTRIEPVRDEQGTPTFISYSAKYEGSRISRNGLRWIINAILTALGKKTEGNSCHSLRHSCGTNLYSATKDLRLVQETLRHKDPMTSARYAHAAERIEQRQTSQASPFKK